MIKECSHPECSFCHPELDSGSHVVVRHVKRKVGKIPNRLGLLLHSDKSLILLSQPFAMSSLLRRFASLQPTQNPQVWNDTAGQGGFLIRLMVRRIAFTMAEILLSLTIIGVVAAITLPSLVGNINERTWNTQRKALHARMSQAVSLMPSLNGYGAVSGTGSGSAVAADNATETFLTAGLSKVLKINNICDAEHIVDCGISSNYTTMNGSLKTWSSAPTVAEFNMYILNSSTTVPNTKAAAFETANGESVLSFYNPYCQAYMDETDYYYAQSKLCANFIYDLNGIKGPNTVGKDMGFMSVFYPYDPVVVLPVVKKGSENGVCDDSYHVCVQACSALDARIANKEELSSVFYNQMLLKASGLGFYAYSGSRTTYPGTNIFAIGMPRGDVLAVPYGNMHSTVCVER